MKKIVVFLGAIGLAMAVDADAMGNRVDAIIPIPGRVKLGRSLGFGTVADSGPYDQAIGHSFTIPELSTTEHFSAASLDYNDRQGRREFDGRTGIFDIIVEFTLDGQLTRIHILLDRPIKPRDLLDKPTIEYNVINEANKSLIGGWKSVYDPTKYVLTKATGEPGKTARMIIYPRASGTIIDILYGIKEMGHFDERAVGAVDSGTW